MESGENTTTIPQTEHKVPSITDRDNTVATQWQKAALLQTGGFKFLLKPLKGLRKGKFFHSRENTGVQIHTFYQRRRLKFLKAPNKTQQKTTKQFILAQTCRHWVTTSKITVCYYICLIAYIKVLGRSQRKWSCISGRTLFTGRKMTFLLKQSARENQKLLTRGKYSLFRISEGTVFFMLSIPYPILPYVIFISNTKASRGCSS